MKKLVIGTFCLVFFGAGLVNAEDTKSKDKKNTKLVSIDSLLLMQKSKEGKILAEKLQKDVEEFQNFAKNAQKEITDYQETIQKQAKALSKEALIEKGEKLEKMRKNAERQLADKETDLKRKIQREQMILREKQLSVTAEIFDKKGWGLMIDRNTPGVLFVNNSIDKTENVLKAVDENFEKNVAQAVVEKETNKKSVAAKSTKTA
jgi:outer membrane protein